MYSVETIEVKTIAEYTGISVFEVENLCYYDYCVLRHDAFIYRMRQTEGGRKYLYDCWALEQTKPDRKALREKFGNRER